MDNQGICSNAFILNPKGEFLLVKRGENDLAFPGNWELPGGGIDYGENIESSLIREIKEECGLSVNTVKPVAVNNFYIDKIQYFEITYFCEVINGFYDVKLSTEHSEYKWVSLNDISILEGNDYMQRTIKQCRNNLNGITP